MFFNNCVTAKVIKSSVNKSQSLEPIETTNAAGSPMVAVNKIINILSLIPTPFGTIKTIILIKFENTKENQKNTNLLRAKGNNDLTKRKKAIPRIIDIMK